MTGQGFVEAGPVQAQARLGPELVHHQPGSLHVGLDAAHQSPPMQQRADIPTEVLAIAWYRVRGRIVLFE